MKREYLKELGLEADVIDKVMAEYGRSIEDYKTRIEALEATNSEIKDKLTAYDGVDVEALKNQINTTEENYKNKLKQIRIDAAIDKALSNAKARHPELLKSKFNIEKLEVDEEGNVNGIDEQIDGIKEKYEDLFKPNVQGQNPASPNNNGDIGFNFDFQKIREK